MANYNHSPLNEDGSTLWLAYMLKQLLGSSLMEILKPGCPRNVESGETSLSWIYPRSIGPQCKIKDQRYCVGSKGPWKSLQVTVSINNTCPSILGVLVTDDSCSCHLWGSVRDGGADVGQQEQPGGEAGTPAHLLTHSVSHCQFMFQTLQHLVRMVLYLGCKGQRAVTNATPFLWMLVQIMARLPVSSVFSLAGGGERMEGCN